MASPRYHKHFCPADTWCPLSKDGQVELDEASVLLVADDQHHVQVVVVMLDEASLLVADDHVQVVPLQHLPRCLWPLHVPHQLLPSTHQMLKTRC